KLDSSSDSSSDNLSIELGSISKATGSKGRIVRHPTLILDFVTKTDMNSKQTRTVTFLQEMTGKRKKNLNDWAEIISKVKSGEFADRIKNEITKMKGQPSLETLEGKVLYILGDLQSKGVVSN